MPPGGGFIPPFGGVGLSPHRGGFIPAKGWFYPSKGVVSSPHWVIFLGGGMGWFYPPFGGGFIPTTTSGSIGAGGGRIAPGPILHFQGRQSTIRNQMRPVWFRTYVKHHCTTPQQLPFTMAHSIEHVANTAWAKIVCRQNREHTVSRTHLQRPAYTTHNHCYDLAAAATAAAARCTISNHDSAKHTIQPFQCSTLLFPSPITI